MTVWCVFNYVEWEGSFLCSIWSTEELADQEADRLNQFYHSENYGVESYEVG